MALGRGQKRTWFAPDRDSAGEMIAWLRDKPQDVWLEAAGALNWDDAVPVFEWMISRPECDRAVAACIFWLSSPDTAAASPAARQRWERDSGGGRVGAAVLRNWDKGLYRDSNLEFALDGLAGIISACRSQGARALDIPRAFHGPFHGRAPRIRRRDNPRYNSQVWDLYDALGTVVGTRPGWSRPFKIAWARIAGEWKRSVMASYPLRFASDDEMSRYIGGDKAAEEAVRRRRRMDGWSRIRRELRQTFTWLGAFSVVAIGAAVVLRRLHFGVWF